MKKKQYSVIVFDLGNVLIPFNYNLIIERLDKIEVGLGKKFYDLYKKNYQIHRQYERGALSDLEFLDILLNWADHKIDREKFCRIYSDIFNENKKVTSLLPGLKEKYKLVLLSNTNHIHKKYGWANYPFLIYFDKQILSFEVGAVKPERKIYKAVEDFSKMPSNEHIFIDDILDYVNGAKTLGWDAIQFKGYEDLLGEFKKRNIL